MNGRQLVARVVIPAAICMLLAAVCFGDSGTSKSSLIQFGAGRAVVTPAVGTPLAGFAGRVHASEALLDDLEIKAFWFQSVSLRSDATCIVVADVIGFSDDLATRIRNEISRQEGIPLERVLLVATHIYTGPVIEGNADNVTKARDLMTQGMLSAVKAAHGDLHPVTLHVGQGTLADYAVNSRLIVKGSAQSLPNPNGPRDDAVNVISCRDASDGHIRAVLFQYTCQPTTLSRCKLSAGYPGAARRLIETSLGNGVSAQFLPGCCGDVQANCTYVMGNRFRDGEPEDIEFFGRALGNEVLRVLQERNTPLDPHLFGSSLTVELPVAKHPRREDLQNLIANGTPDQKRNAALVLSKPFPTGKPFTIHRIDLAKNLVLVGMSGDVCNAYGHFAKGLKRKEHILPMGYSDGSARYIPTAAMFAEGGYEVQSSQLYDWIASPVKPEIERIVKDGIQTILMTNTNPKP